MMPKCCGSFELVVAAPVGRQEAQPSVPLYADPFVMLLALLFLMQAWMFMKVGDFFSRRGHRAVALKLEATTKELKDLKEAHQKLCARTRATGIVVERIFLTTTGDLAHLNKQRCPSLRHSADLTEVQVCLHCQRVGPGTGT